jgi:hypothetical protein
VRTREAQRKALIYAAAGGLVGGALLWAVVAGPIARALSASWRAPEKMAAAILGVDRWAAGLQLMRSVDAAAWDNVVAASNLWRDNAKTLEACSRSAAKVGRPASCKVMVAPQATSERDGASASPAGTIGTSARR